MTEWERFKQRIIHHNDQYDALVNERIGQIGKRKKRRKQLLKFVKEGKGGKKFLKWLDKKKNRHIMRVLDRLLSEDGLMNDLLSDPGVWEGEDDDR